MTASDADNSTLYSGRSPHADPGAGRGALAFVFDLDGTLVDSVYQHVLAWREALETAGIALAVWRIHRRIGMSGGLLVNALLRETGHQVTAEEAARLQRLHAATYVREVRQVRLLPDARELLAYLSHAGVPWAIATSGRLETVRPTLELLELSPDVPVITRDQVQHAKPDPDLFLAAADRLGVPISAAVVVGDSVWDLLAARRARALGVGLLSGGYGQEELERAGAYHVYQMAEQNMLSCAGGLAAGGKLPFVSTCGKFFIRAYDQVEMDFISRFPLKLVGSHVGVSLAVDGPSQIALPDVTFFRAWTTVCTPDGKPLLYLLQPADAYAAYALTVAMAEYDGPCYLRTVRPDVPFLYSDATTFPLGGHHVLNQGHDLCIVAAGYMVHEARKALALLKEQGIAATLVDLYSLPLDEGAILGLVQDNQGQVLTVEDNYGAGIGSAVAEMLATRNGAYTLTQMHVRRIPKSGRTPDDVLRALQLSASDIAQTAVRMLDVTTR